LEAAHKSNIPFLASALTFDALLAAIPLILLILVGLTRAVDLSPGASDVDLSHTMERFLPPHAIVNGQDPFGAVERLLRGVTRNRGRLSLYAIPLFLWFSTRLFASVRTALRTIFHASWTPVRRHALIAFVLGKVRDGGMVIATVVLFAANTALTALLGVVEARGETLLSGAAPLHFLVTTMGRFLAVLLAYGFGVSLFLLVYKYATARRLPWRSALVASVFAALAVEVAKRLFGVYLQYVAARGAITTDATLGALIIFVLWVYFTALVFLYGGVIAETWTKAPPDL